MGTPRPGSGPGGQRRGTVFLAWEESDPEGFYQGYWDGWPGSEGMLERMTPTTSFAGAVGWARERSTRVLMRPQHCPSTTFSVGDEDVCGYPALRE